MGHVSHRLSIFNDEGKLEDTRLRRTRNGDGTFNKNHFLVYLGDTLIGHLVKIGKTWSVVSSAPNEDLGGFRSVDGFATKIYAIQYLLLVDNRINYERSR